MSRFEIGGIAYLNRSDLHGRLVEIIDLMGPQGGDDEGSVNGRALVRPLESTTYKPVWVDTKSLLEVRSPLKSLAEQA